MQKMSLLFFLSCCRASWSSSAKDMLIVDAYERRNMVSYINDMRTRPESTYQQQKQNKGNNKATKPTATVEVPTTAERGGRGGRGGGGRGGRGGKRGGRGKRRKVATINDEESDECDAKNSTNNNNNKKGNNNIDINNGGNADSSSNGGEGELDRMQNVEFLEVSIPPAPHHPLLWSPPYSSLFTLFSLITLLLPHSSSISSYCFAWCTSLSTLTHTYIRIHTQVQYFGWPFVVCVAVCDIEAGTELLSDYGEQFWDKFCDLQETQRFVEQIKKQRDGMKEKRRRRG